MHFLPTLRCHVNSKAAYLGMSSAWSATHLRSRPPLSCLNRIRRLCDRSRDYQDSVVFRSPRRNFIPNSVGEWRASARGPSITWEYFGTLESYSAQIYLWIFANPELFKSVLKYPFNKLRGSIVGCEAIETMHSQPIQ